MTREQPLDDRPDRAYTDSLVLLHEFMEPELHDIIANLGLQPGQRVLDAGCGIGGVTHMLSERMRETGLVVGLDLSTQHIERAARAGVAEGACYVQGDLCKPPFARASFDLVWSCNALPHVGDPVRGARELALLLRGAGRLVLAQGHLLPEMVLAWDAALEERVTRACRAAYRARYGLVERETSGVRRVVGWLRDAGLADVRVTTRVIERTQPLGPADERYLREYVFGRAWGEAARSLLSAEDRAALDRLTDPDGPDYALRRPDFHYLQTLTVAAGRAAAR